MFMIGMLGMDIDDIRAFIAVVDAGSVSAAARELFVTQPAVTRRLQRLESSVGAPLLDRRRRPIALTSAGQAAIERCRAVLVSMQELRTLAEDGQKPGGELRIGVAHALTELTLAAPVDEAQRRFPRVVLRLSTGWSRDLLERVRTQAVDAAFLLLPKDEGLPVGVTGVRLADERLVVVSSRTKHRGTVRPADLAGQSWVLNPEGCAARAALRNALLGAGANLRVGVETYNYELQLSLVARGRGLGLVPGRLLARSRYRRRVRALRLRGLDFGMTIWSVRGRPPLPLERVLEELDRIVAKRLSSQRLDRKPGWPLRPHQVPA
jgi:DNA-binding transcriptional LysR family regulator